MFDQLRENIYIDLKRALVGGGVAALIALGGGIAIGEVSGAEGYYLVENSLPSIRSLCNTVILVSATVLALMLTVLGLSADVDAKVKPQLFKRIRQLASVDALVFVVAMILYLAFNAPLPREEIIPQSWYGPIFYTTLACSALLGGALITVILMIHDTIRDLVNMVGLEGEDAEVSKNPSSESDAPEAAQDEAVAAEK